MTNLSYLDFNVPMDQAIEYNAVDIIGDLCTQINDKIALACLFIGVCWVFAFVILPRSRAGIESIGFLKQYHFPMILDHLISFCETLALGSVIFIVVIAWVQDIFSDGHKKIIIGLLVICGIIVLSQIIGYIRRKGWKKDLDYIEKIGGK